jgi:hypothetical protein
MKLAAALLLAVCGAVQADGRICVLYITDDRTRDVCVDTPPAAYDHIVSEPVQEITFVREISERGDESYSWLGGSWVSVPGEFRVFTTFRQYVIGADFLIVYASLDPIFTAPD